MLSELATDEEVSVRKAVARNVGTKVETLRELSEDTDQGVRWNVVDNANCAVDILWSLHEDAYSEVRAKIATSTKSPSDLLIKLEVDKDESVRCAAYCNSSLPLELANKLLSCEDTDPYLALRVAEITGRVDEVVMQLLSDGTEGAKLALASSRLTNSEVLELLCEDGNTEVILAVMKNTNCTREILLKISKMYSDIQFLNKKKK